MVYEYMQWVRDELTLWTIERSMQGGGVRTDNCWFSQPVQSLVVSWLLGQVVVVVLVVVATEWQQLTLPAEQVQKIYMLPGKASAARQHITSRTSCQQHGH